MTTMNISLPEEMKAFVDQQVREKGFMTASEYIRDLIRDQKEIVEFRAKDVAGMTSGNPQPADTD